MAQMFPSPARGISANHDVPLDCGACPAAAPGVRAGYGLGSVATGAFGTVPGLMLLPYLTDTLGIAARRAGLIVFLPKAWDVVLNPIAGRISDRSTDPRGPRRPFLLRGGLLLAVCFALLFAAPDLGLEGRSTRRWVLVLFVACATAYAFFQVPYVAMPAEITDSYDERTRLMTWRVAILALAIMLSGASAPAIRDAVGGRAGYRVMGVVVALLIVVGVVGAYVGTRSAPDRRASAPGAGTLRDQLRIVGRRPRLPAAADHLRAAGARDRRDARRASPTSPAGCSVDKAAATLLFVCFVGPALLLTPGLGALGRSGSARSSGYVAASLRPRRGRRCSLVLVAVGADVRGSYARDRRSSASATPAPRSSRWRCCPTSPPWTPAAPGPNRAGVYTGVWTAGETLGLALGPGGLRPGARARRLPSPATAARTSSPSPTPRSPRSCSASRCCRRR